MLREIPWSSHLLIISKTKSKEEREYYLQIAVKERYFVRELDHAIKSYRYERTVATTPKLSPVARQLHPAAETIFRDSYTLDFLGLSAGHSESDLRNGSVHSFKNFIIEFGRDFAFIGEEYQLQVGMQDFLLICCFFNAS